jgi:hypothetical protein
MWKAAALGVLLAALATLAPVGAVGDGQQEPPRACCAAKGATCCCGNAEFVSAAPGDDKGKKASAEAVNRGHFARRAIIDHHKVLTKEGVYSCCIVPGCSLCANAGDMCPCAKSLEKGGPVCPECYGGWNAGYGRLKGVDVQKVTIIPVEQLKTLYEMRYKSFEKAISK